MNLKKAGALIGAVAVLSIGAWWVAKNYEKEGQFDQFLMGGHTDPRVVTTEGLHLVMGTAIGALGYALLDEYF